MPWILLPICLIAVVALAIGVSVVALILLAKRLVRKLHIRVKLWFFEWEMDGER